MIVLQRNLSQYLVYSVFPTNTKFCRSYSRLRINKHDQSHYTEKQHCADPKIFSGCRKNSSPCTEVLHIWSSDSCSVVNVTLQANSFVFTHYINSVHLRNINVYIHLIEQTIATLKFPTYAVIPTCT